ncbi:MAG: TolC family protein [Coprobacter sp.]|nr:TolC family protein [Coprobacter sp.]
MRKWVILCIGLLSGAAAMGQPVFTLDSCRHMALSSNKQLCIAEEKVKAAGYERRSAFANYLPGIDVTGTYMYNSKEISLLNQDQKAGLSQLGTQMATSAQTLLPPAYLQQFGPLLAGLVDPLNALGTSLADAFRTNTTNVFAGMITVTQPLYMGGKIRAYHQITQTAEELARSQKNTLAEELVYRVDEAYWQVISLVYKKQLAESYLHLLDTLNNHVQMMIEEGVATRSDGLAVAVKLNEAQITLTKVEDGLSLSRMLLAQLCGLPVDLSYVLADENAPLQEMVPARQPVDMESVYARRGEIRSLTLATDIYRYKQKVALSAMLPNLGLTGSYLFSNPSVFNGFENKFGGMFNVGVILKVPVFHWGKDYYKVKAARTERNIAQLQLEEAKEKIGLQVSQASFKMNEAGKKLEMTRQNMEKAEENLRNARYGFEEGVLTASNVLEAQTAWLQAESEKIDAEIDVRLCRVYLAKALGTMNE